MTSAIGAIPSRVALWAREVSNLKAKPTVVCIGGLLARPYQMVPLHAAIKSRCNFNVIQYEYAGRSLTLNEHALELAELISMVKQGLHFVTHSMGGLILRSALSRLSWQGSECRVVMIAPMNTGCFVARYLTDLDTNPTLRAVAAVVLGNKAGQELMEMAPEDITASIPPLPKHFPAMVVVGTLNSSWGTPFLPKDCVADGVILESETKLATPAVYMPVHASHTMILYHPTTLMATTGFLNDPKAYFHAAS